MTRRKTAFDRYIASRARKSHEFAVERRRAKSEIRLTDAIMRELDDRRTRAKMTKAELARRAGVPAETVRRLFTSRGINPELNTVSRLAAGLGYRLALEPA